MRELVEDAWAFCAPEKAVDEYRRTVSGSAASIR
jgi:hypothetical protein